MAGLIALFLLGLGGLFLLQNREPILLYFLGNSSQTALFQVTLPLGAWTALFVLAGLLLGLILPVCYRLGQPLRKNSPKPSQPAFGYAQEVSSGYAQKVRKDASSSNAQDPPPEKTWDWNPIPEAEDWQEPKPAPTPPEPKPLEREQAPPQSRQEGSVYRYQYRDKTTAPPPEGVYTAPYRVIASPQTPAPAPESSEEEEGDWV